MGVREFPPRSPSGSSRRVSRRRKGLYTPAWVSPLRGTWRRKWEGRSPWPIRRRAAPRPFSGSPGTETPGRKEGSDRCSGHASRGDGRIPGMRLLQTEVYREENRHADPRQGAPLRNHLPGVRPSGSERSCQKTERSAPGLDGRTVGRVAAKRLEEDRQTLSADGPESGVPGGDSLPPGLQFMERKACDESTPPSISWPGPVVLPPRTAMSRG